MAKKYSRHDVEEQMREKTTADAVHEFSALLGFKENKKIVTAHEFVFEYAYTLDPHDYNNPIKRFPSKHYVKRFIDIWLEEKLMLCVKSRQMMATWLCVALNLWLAMYHRGQYIFFISRKESDAGLDSPLSILSRAFFIYCHLPVDMQTPLVKTAAPPIMRFPEMDSVIQGVSQDSDALRQYTASSIFNDEMAFQDKSRESYAALKPTIDGGGRLTCVSTPNGKNNLFYELVNDISR